MRSINPMNKGSGSLISDFFFFIIPVLYVLVVNCFLEQIRMTESEKQATSQRLKIESPNFT